MENIILKNNFLSIQNKKELLYYYNAPIINIKYLVSFKYFNVSNIEEHPYIVFEMIDKRKEKWFFKEYEIMCSIFEEMEKIILNNKEPKIF